MSESLNVSVGVCVHGDGIVALRLHELMNLCEHLMHASLLCRFEGWQTEMPEYNKRRSQCPNVVSAYLPQEYGDWESEMCRIINSKYLIDFNTWPFFRLFTLHSISIEWPNDSILFSAHNHYRNDILSFFVWLVVSLEKHCTLMANENSFKSLCLFVSWRLRSDVFFFLLFVQSSDETHEGKNSKWMEFLISLNVSNNATVK